MNNILRRGIAMAELTRPDGATIHYQVTGSGYPLLALAPGDSASEIGQWAQAAIHPVDAFDDEFMVVTMDQRYAGESRAPLAPFSYQQSLGDQLAVLDAIGAASAHIVGADIGSAHALRLMYEAPARVSAAVLLDPLGRHETNTMDTFYNAFNETIRVARADGLGGVVSAAARNPSFTDNPAAGPWARRLHDDPSFCDALRSLGRENYIALVVDFRDGIWPWNRRYFSVNDVAVARIEVPMLVFSGNDLRHPRGVGQQICAEAVNARNAESDAHGAQAPAALAAMRNFLHENSAVSSGADARPQA